MFLRFLIPPIATSWRGLPGELTGAMVALVVGRPERVDWLRYYAPYTKVHKNPINP